VHWAFSERSDGDFAVTAPEGSLHADRHRLAARPWTWLHQVHGSIVVVVNAAGEHAGVDADAAVTAVAGAVLAVQTADCAPVLLWGWTAAGAPVIGAAHAGWRGLYDGVVENTVAALRRLGASEVHARLGPCISAPAYEFSATDLTTMALRFGPDVVAGTADGAPALDMAEAVRSALRSARVDAGATVTPDCTATALTAQGEPRFWSWRARADIGRQASVIWIEP